ncbi:MAG TPA: radical SAM protein [Anaerolineae bacterium]|nr:radical SAM protein [Anaerolineae bacterium]
MVAIRDLGNRLSLGWKERLGVLWGGQGALAPPGEGMHTYQIELPGGQKRIHLRVEAAGISSLFVDVTDVIHLNETATAMVYWALEEVPEAEALRHLIRLYGRGSLAQMKTELGNMYEMVARFHEPTMGCPTCAVNDLQRKPLFSQRARAPYKADLAVTYGCNNACSHCYNEPDRFDMGSMPFEAWQKVIDQLHEVGVPHLIFTGGEATLHPDLPRMIQYADGLGHVVGLNSNGRRIAHLPYMEELAAAGLNHIQVTLGSSRADVHDAVMNAKSFTQTVKGIKNAVASRVHVITNTTLMRCNMDHVEEIIDFLYELGIRTFAMNGMIYSGGGFADPNAIPEVEMPPLLIRVRDHAAAKGMRFLWYTPTEYCRMSPVELEIGAKRCNAGEYSICIEPNGDILPCQSFYVAAGNILNDPWEEIWDSELFRSFRDREDDPEGWGLPEKCWECPDLALCGGGCRIEREARDGERVAGGCDGCAGSCGTGRSGSDRLRVGFVEASGLFGEDDNRIMLNVL